MASLGRVLVVDDEPEVALVLHDALQDFGYDVRIAVDGPEALRVVPLYDPDVVFLDLTLPGMRGEVVFEELRQRHPTVPVVIVSGNRDVDAGRALLHAGVFDYLPKPFEFAVLERIVAAAVVTRGR